MTQQLDLFAVHPPLEQHQGGSPVPPPAKREGEARARKSDSLSSHVAAQAMDDSGATKNHTERIEAVVFRGGGWTLNEIAREVGLSDVQVSRRMSTIPTIRKADDTLARKCRVTGKKVSTYWAKSTFGG